MHDAHHDAFGVPLVDSDLDHEANGETTAVFSRDGDVDDGELTDVFDLPAEEVFPDLRVQDEPSPEFFGGRFSERTDVEQMPLAYDAAGDNDAISADGPDAETGGGYSFDDGYAPPLSAHDLDDARALLLEAYSMAAADLMRLAARVAQRSADVDDIVQAAFEKGLTHLAAFSHGDVHKTIGWLRQAVKYEASEERRRARRATSTDPGSLDEIPAGSGLGPEDAAASHEEFLERFAAVQELPQQVRMSVILMGAGYRRRDVAAMLDVSEKGAKKLLEEGRHLLRLSADDSASGKRCQRVSAMLGDWTMGELEGREAKTVRSHLAHCGGCAAEAKRVRIAHRDFVRSLPVALVLPGAFIALDRAFAEGQSVTTEPAVHAASVGGDGIFAAAGHMSRTVFVGGDSLVSGLSSGGKVVAIGGAAVLGLFGVGVGTNMMKDAPAPTGPKTAQVAADKGAPSATSVSSGNPEDEFLPGGAPTAKAPPVKASPPSVISAPTPVAPSRARDTEPERPVAVSAPNPSGGTGATTPAPKKPVVSAPPPRRITQPAASVRWSGGGGGGPAAEFAP